MKYLVLATALLNSCAFNEVTTEEILEAQSRLQMKYAELDLRLDQLVQDMNELRGTCTK